ADICVCTDLDEVFEKGWRQKLENAWQKDIKQARYQYNWSLDEKNRPEVSFYNFKIHSRFDFVWKNPVHEYLEYQGQDYKVVFIEDLILNHYPDKNKSRASYLSLLELSVKENPQDSRSWYYLGREYKLLGMWDKSIKTLKKYLELDTSTWKDERAAALRDIAKCYLNKSDYSNAYQYYWKAIYENPSIRETYAEFAQVAYYNEDYLTVANMAKKAFRIKSRSKNYISESFAWDWTLPDIAAIACYNLKQYDQALKYAKIAYELNPDDQRLKDNYEFIKSIIKN
ncbi:MAG TPA: glycosyl transferase family 2, partial [Clostridia bacterium]